MSAPKLSEKEILTSLENLQSWTFKNNKLHREIKFKNFIEAFSFMTAVALEAQKMDHHPDWENVYNRVVINLNTHDAGGVTRQDFDLATRIERVLAKSV